MFLALLSTHFNTRCARAKMSLSLVGREYQLYCHIIFKTGRVTMDNGLQLLSVQKKFANDNN